MAIASLTKDLAPQKDLTLKVRSVFLLLYLLYLQLGLLVWVLVGYKFAGTIVFLHIGLDFSSFGMDEYSHNKLLIGDIIPIVQYRPPPTGQKHQRNHNVNDTRGGLRPKID